MLCIALKAFKIMIISRSDFLKHAYDFHVKNSQMSDRSCFKENAQNLSSYIKIRFLS